MLFLCPFLLKSGQLLLFDSPQLHVEAPLVLEGVGDFDLLQAINTGIVELYQSSNTVLKLLQSHRHWKGWRHCPD